MILWTELSHSLASLPSLLQLFSYKFFFFFRILKPTSRGAGWRSIAGLRVRRAREMVAERIQWVEGDKEDFFGRIVCSLRKFLSLKRGSVPTGKVLCSFGNPSSPTHALKILPPKIKSIITKREREKKKKKRT